MEAIVYCKYGSPDVLILPGDKVCGGGNFFGGIEYVYADFSY